MKVIISFKGIGMKTRVTLTDQECSDNRIEFYSHRPTEELWEIIHQLMEWLKNNENS